MTCHLPLPAQCSVALIDQVVLDRQNGVNAMFFTGIQASWKQKVTAYVANGGNPEVVASWGLPEAEGKMIRGLYASAEEHFCHVPVIRSIRERTLDYCPACGEDGTPNTLDHYLPKNTFPEYAIAPANLYPMCDICQGHKGTDTLDANRRRLFLHPYFDNFLVDQVVHLKVLPPYDRPTFKLDASENLLAPQREVVLRHLTQLKLDARYQTYLERAYIRLLRLCADTREIHADIPAHLSIWRRNARRKAVNGWDHILYAAAEDNDDLLEYLSHGFLPEHL